MSNAQWCIFLWALFAVVIQLTRQKRRCYGYPPGPHRLPLIGHLLSVPTRNQHIAFHQLSQKFGTIMHFEVFGQHVVVLDNVKTCADLLEQRGSLYSDRPQLTITNLLHADDLPLMPYGDRFRKHRKLIHSHFTKAACVGYLQSQRQNAVILALNLVKFPSSQGEEYLNVFASSTITEVVSGYPVVSPEDEWIQLMKEHAIISHDISDLAVLLDFFPFLQHLPSWFPGTGIATYARRKSWVFQRIYDKAYECVQLSSLKSRPSVLSAELAKLGATDLHIDALTVDDLKRLAGAVLRAANDTTASTLHIFILVMTLHPDVQRRAQAEIDQVVGSDRLPESVDSLPYTSALVQELLRWYPIISLGFPHQSVKDDIYDGYFIPKGSLMITNLYGMSRDESVYQNPSKFDPTRFLPRPEGREEPPFQAAFGFGRRICPGRHFAYNALWIAVATCLATLRISKKVDVEGNEITFDPEFSAGAISSPKPFPFQVSPRSDQARDLLETSNSMGNAT